MNLLMKIKKAQDVCFEEWKTEYKHNKVLPKLALVGMTILLVITLIAII